MSKTIRLGGTFAYLTFIVENLYYSLFKVREKICEEFI